MGHTNHLYPRTVYFWETTVTILSTLHTYINTFIFKVVPVETYMCPMLSHYWTHLWKSTLLILYRIACHSTSIATIFISGKRKKSQRVRSCKSGGEPPPCTLILKCVKKTQPCDLTPCCKAEHGLFVLFPLRFLPNSNFNGLTTLK